MTVRHPGKRVGGVPSPPWSEGAVVPELAGESGDGVPKEGSPSRAAGGLGRSQPRPD